jgi:hypothetical protein
VVEAVVRDRAGAGAPQDPWPTPPDHEQIVRAVGNRYEHLPWTAADDVRCSGEIIRWGAEALVERPQQPLLGGVGPAVGDGARVRACDGVAARRFPRDDGYQRGVERARTIEGEA